jgi:uncharacterized membrane protein
MAINVLIFIIAVFPFIILLKSFRALVEKDQRVKIKCLWILKFMNLIYLFNVSWKLIPGMLSLNMDTVHSSSSSHKHEQGPSFRTMLWFYRDQYSHTAEP